MVDVTCLYKRFGSIEAVRGGSFRVAPGETFGQLGPNGAGKIHDHLDAVRAAEAGCRHRQDRRYRVTWLWAILMLAAYVYFFKRSLSR